MRQSQTYALKLYDEQLAWFSFQKTMTGFRACGLEVNGDRAELLPLNMCQNPNDTELARFLTSRRIPKGRVFLEEMLRPYGLAPSDTKGIIDLSRGVSVNDAYSVVPADDDIPYADYNLFDNDFDEVLQIIAYTGVIPDAIVGTGRPSDLTPSGTFPKTWRKIEDKLVLFKAGSTIAAPNYGKEPYSELLAWQVANVGGFDAVAYELAEWQDRLCSTCELFNTPDIAFVPFELCLSADIALLLDFELMLSYFQDISADAEQKIRSLAVFDSIIANTDRHVGNFGVLRENSTGRVIDAAPIFDNNASLFTRYFDEQLELNAMLKRIEYAPGILDATLGWQGIAIAGDMQLSQVARLAEFEFEATGFLQDHWDSHPDQEQSISPTRLAILGQFVRARAQAILSSR